MEAPSGRTSEAAKVSTPVEKHSVSRTVRVFASSTKLQAANREQTI
jgi:hypothetical protein